MLRLIKEPPATGAFLRRYAFCRTGDEDAGEKIPGCGGLQRAAARELQHAAGRKFRGAAGFRGRQLESINFTAGKVEILLAIIKFSA